MAKTVADAFAIEEAQLAAWGAQDLLSVDIRLNYAPAMVKELTGSACQAALKWSVLSNVFKDDVSVREFRIILAASLYAKVLVVSGELRRGLFERVEMATQSCLRSKDFADLQFQPWVFEHRSVIKSFSFQNLVWPWTIESWDDVEPYDRNPSALGGERNFAKTHTAYLLTGPKAPLAPGGLWLKYRPEQEWSVVLMPAAALVAIAEVHRGIPEGRGMLLSLLAYINRYYRGPEHVRFGSDASAVNAALSVVTSGGKKSIDEFRQSDSEIAAADSHIRENYRPSLFTIVSRWLTKK